MIHRAKPSARQAPGHLPRPGPATRPWRLAARAAGLVGVHSYLQVHFKPYRVIYRVVGQTVVVLVIADGRHNLKALLARRLLGAP